MILSQPITWILLCPILGWLTQSLLGGRIFAEMGRQKGKAVMGFLGVLPIAIAFVLGIGIVNQLAHMPEAERVIQVKLFDWLNLFNLQVPIEMRMDTLSMTMVLIITGIGSLIHLYATGYMAEEKDFSRFFGYLNLFIAFMLILVLGNNLAMLFIGWEGVGLCSYLLIGFWYKDLANARAANKAFIVNRIGDVGLTIGIFLIGILMIQNRGLLPAGEQRWLSYDVILPLIPRVLGSNPALTTTIALCLFVGAMGKSAQFPLYLWLPDAMAGPTPVSALIHAATMVTAGVFMVNRMHVVYELSPEASSIIMVIGCFTAVFAALIAFGQTDIKKVLAYSTVSQLGFMFIACGAGYYWVGIYHVITHAFFKALLFLGSGAVIYGMNHEQDMRRYGNLHKYLPITCYSMILGYIAIAGVPGTSGWFSKELILSGALGGEHATIGGVHVGNIIGWVGFGAALLTAIYMTRMMVLTFDPGEERWRNIEPHLEHAHDHDDHDLHPAHAHADHGPDVNGFFFTDEEMAAQHHEHEHHHELDKSHEPKEVPWSMWVPLVVLAFFSLAGGWWLSDSFNLFGMKGHLLEHWLYPEGLSVLSAESLPEHPHHVNHMLMEVLGYGIGILGMIIGFLWYFRGLPKSEGYDMKKWSPVRLAMREQFGYDRTMVEAGVDGGGVLANFLWKVVDVSGVDGLVNNIARAFGGISLGLRKAESGYARTYALWMLIGGAAFVTYLVYQLTQHKGGWL